jgi:hypothetical protein
MTTTEKPHESIKPHSSSLKERAKAKMAAIQAGEISQRAKGVIESVKVLSNIVPGVYAYSIHYGVHLNNVFLTHNPNMQINPSALKFALSTAISLGVYAVINKKQMKVIFKRENS